MGTKMSFLLLLLSLTLSVHGTSESHREQNPASSSKADKQQYKTELDLFSKVADSIQSLASSAKSLVFPTTYDEDVRLNGDKTQNLVNDDDIRLNEDKRQNLVDDEPDFKAHGEARESKAHKLPLNEILDVNSKKSKYTRLENEIKEDIDDNNVNINNDKIIRVSYNNNNENDGIVDSKSLKNIRDVSNDADISQPTDKEDDGDSEILDRALDTPRHRLAHDQSKLQDVYAVSRNPRRRQLLFWFLGDPKTTKKTSTISSTSKADTSLLTSAYPTTRETDTPVLTSTYPATSETDTSVLTSTYPTTSETDTSVLTSTYPTTRETDTSVLTSTYPTTSETDTSVLTSTYPATSETDTSVVTSTYPTTSETDTSVLTSTFPATSETDTPVLTSTFPATSETDTPKVTTSETKGTTQVKPTSRTTSKAERTTVTKSTTAETTTNNGDTFTDNSSKTSTATATSKPGLVHPATEAAKKNKLTTSVPISAAGGNSTIFTTKFTETTTVPYFKTTSATTQDPSFKTTRSNKGLNTKLNDSGVHDIDLNTASKQALQKLYKECDTCMTQWNVGRSTTECSKYVSPVNEFDRAAREFSNILRYGCDGQGGSSARCCHAQRNEVNAVINQLTRVSQAVTKILKDQCDKCPVNCHWHEWSEWTDCPTPTCEGRTKTFTTTRTRTAHRERYGGKHCVGRETETNQCPPVLIVRREWEAWKSWSSWSTKLDYPPRFLAVRRRYRACGIETDMSGQRICFQKCVGDYTEEERCRESRWESWSSWSVCGAGLSPLKVSCGEQSGLTTRTRRCREGNCGVSCHGDSQQQVYCVLRPCCAPRDWTPWDEWSPCGTTPSRPRHHRVRCRRCEADQRSRELWCPQPCPGQDKEIDDCCSKSTWNTWSGWTTCRSPTGQIDLDSRLACGDGDGYQNRTRTCEVGTCGDQCKGDTIQSKSCYMKPCCVPLTPSGWSEWETCIGNPPKSRRKRTCERQSQDRRNAPVCRTGYVCREEHEEKGCICDLPEWDLWSTWTGCDVGRYQNRTRICRKPIRNSPECPPLIRTHCVGKQFESKECPCAPKQWADWGKWTPCSLLAGQSKEGMTRHRTCGRDVTSHLPACPDPCPGSDQETKDCCTPAQWTTWASWSDCASDNFKIHLDTGKPCGEGTGCRNRTRTCSTGTCEKKYCEGDNIETDTECTADPCCVPRVLSGWGAWESCTSDGFSTRYRSCISSPEKPRNAPDCFNLQHDICGRSSLKETKKCDCDPAVWVTWQRWTGCDASGIRTRTRQCRMPTSVKPECGTPTCVGTAKDTEICQCGWDRWSNWTDCNEANTRTRYRRCVETLSNQDCKRPDGCFGDASQTEQCTCAPPEWGPWKVYIQCDFSRNPPTKQLYRDCEKRPGTCGECSGSRTKSERCICEQAYFGEWGPFSKCRINRDGRMVETRRRACISISTPEGDCKNAPPDWFTCHGRDTEERPCSVVTRPPPNKVCEGRRNGEYPSQNRGCNYYIVCCNGQMIPRKCYPPKVYDAICQECLSESRTCSANGLDRYRHIKSRSEILERRHEKCTIRRKRSRYNGCHYQG